MTSTSIFSTRGLVVGYGEASVCAPIDLDVHPGELVAVIGPNGCGKSTLLRTVLGQLAPIKGTIKAFGFPVDEREASFRAKVASILDEDAYFPALTVREHLVLTARGHGVPAAGKVVDELLRRFGMAGHANAVPTALSSGQRRRLLLAAGFARPREAMVLDEPEQRLDPRARADLAALLVDESKAGVGVLFATHDVVLLEATGARAIAIADDKCRKLTPAAAVASLHEIRGA